MTPAACWWCQLWGRQTAPFRSLLNPIAVPDRQVAAQSPWGGGAAPDGPVSLQEAHVLSLQAVWGPGCLGVVGPVPRPRAGTEGRGPQKAFLPDFLPCQLPPPPLQVCLIIPSNTCSSQEFPIPMRTLPSTRCPNTQKQLGPLCLHSAAAWSLASK